MPTIKSPISYSNIQPNIDRPVRSRRVIYLVGGALLAAAVVGVVCLVLWRSDQSGFFSSLRGGGDQQQTQNQQQIEDLVGSVGRLIDLPTTETPTVATVNNLEALKGQEFFARAELGDKVLIYPVAKKAILYSPTKNKIIEVAPLNIPAGEAGGSFDLQKDDTTVAPEGSLQ